MNKFADRFAHALDLKNKTRAEISKETGISEGALSNYYHGRYEPNATNIYLIAKALNVSEAWLLGYDIIADGEESILLERFSALSDKKKKMLMDYLKALLIMPEEDADVL